MMYKTTLFLILLFQTSFLASGEKVLFDAHQVAKEETEAWKDYYNNDIAGLVQHLSHLVIVEFRLNHLTAWQTVIPELLAAATIFKNLPENSSQETYDKFVLPHLVDAYQGIKEGLHGEWEPRKAAQAELAWWIYRRHKATSNPEIVGSKIADLYRLIYGPNDSAHFKRAGYLRAVAARYRDMSQKHWHPMEDSDWNIIENILNMSYSELLLGIETNSK